MDAGFGIDLGDVQRVGAERGLEHPADRTIAAGIDLAAGEPQRAGDGVDVDIVDLALQVIKFVQLVAERAGIVIKGFGEIELGHHVAGGIGIAGRDAGHQVDRILVQRRADDRPAARPPPAGVERPGRPRERGAAVGHYSIELTIGIGREQHRDERDQHAGGSLHSGNGRDESDRCCQ